MLTSYSNVADFLNATQTALEMHEAANSLMLGLSLQIARYPERYKNPPIFATVANPNGLALAALMTPPHNLIMTGFQDEINPAIPILADHFITINQAVPGILAPSRLAQAFTRHWLAVAHQSIKGEWRQSVCELRQVLTPPASQDVLRLATEADRAQVVQWVYGFNHEIFGTDDMDGARRMFDTRLPGGEIYLWDIGKPVSMAVTTRPTRRGISVSYVYTPPELRGKGYATSCVGELSRGLLQAGWEYVALFVDVTNLPALRAYRKIGYQPVGEYSEIAFA